MRCVLARGSVRMALNQIECACAHAGYLVVPAPPSSSSRVGRGALEVQTGFGVAPRGLRALNAN